jgi:hypothetical protein
MTEEEKFAFGMHKGETLRDVIDMDPQYVLWAERKGIIRLSKSAHDAAMRQCMDECSSDEEYYVGCPEQN